MMSLQPTAIFVLLLGNVGKRAHATCFCFKMKIACPFARKGLESLDLQSSANTNFPIRSVELIVFL